MNQTSDETRGCSPFLVQLCQNCDPTPSVQLCSVITDVHSDFLWEFLLFPLPIQLDQSFALHLQFHVRILLENLGVSLPQQLCDPLIGNAAGTEPGGVGGAQIVDAEIGDLGP